jgi:transposase InsO family protein
VEKGFKAQDARTSGTWYVDSACTADMTDLPGELINVRPARGTVTVGGDIKIPYTGVGQVRSYTTASTGERVVFTRNRVLVVPGLGCSLISGGVLCDDGGAVFLTKHDPHIIHPSAASCKIPVHKSGRMYELDLTPCHQAGETAKVSYDAGGADQSPTAEREAHHGWAADGATAPPTTVAMDRALAARAADTETWHARLGHFHINYLQRLGGLGIGVPNNLRDHGACESCQAAKQPRRSHPKVARHRAEEPFQMVHVDLAGPMNVPSLGGRYYFMVFTDDATRWRKIYFLTHKSEAVDMLQDYLRYVRRETDRIWRVRGIRSDRGGEYLSEAFQAVCVEHDIKLRTGGPDAQQQNGVAERTNRTVKEMAQAMRHRAGLPESWWAEATDTAVYLINRRPNKALKYNTPYHALFGEHAPLGHLRTFGCRAYRLLPSAQLRKLDYKALPGILVGITSTTPPDTGCMTRRPDASTAPSRSPSRSSSSPLGASRSAPGGTSRSQ